MTTSFLNLVDNNKITLIMKYEINPTQTNR